jgi:hypothetical protein
MRWKISVTGVAREGFENWRWRLIPRFRGNRGPFFENPGGDDIPEKQGEDFDGQFRGREGLCDQIASAAQARAGAARQIGVMGDKNDGRKTIDRPFSNSGAER